MLESGIKQSLINKENNEKMSSLHSKSCFNKDTSYHA